MLCIFYILFDEHELKKRKKKKKNCKMWRIYSIQTYISTHQMTKELKINAFFCLHYVSFEWKNLILLVSLVLSVFTFYFSSSLTFKKKKTRRESKNFRWKCLLRPAVFAHRNKLFRFILHPKQNENDHFKWDIRS